MGLGNNRDYKTTDRRARRNLCRHYKLMADYQAEGMSREEASQRAYEEMRKKTCSSWSVDKETER